MDAQDVREIAGHLIACGLLTLCVAAGAIAEAIESRRRA